MKRVGTSADLTYIDNNHGYDSSVASKSSNPPNYNFTLCFENVEKENMVYVTLIIEPTTMLGEFQSSLDAKIHTVPVSTRRFSLYQNWAVEKKLPLDILLLNSLPFPSIYSV